MLNEAAPKAESVSGYQTWSNGLDAEPGTHGKSAAATRLTSGGPVDIFHEPKFKLDKKTPIYAIGSCFARNMEKILEDRRYTLFSSKLALPREGYKIDKPSGILTKFNTQSMLTEIELAFGDRTLPEHGLIELRPGQYWNPQLHRTGTYSKELALEVADAVHENVRTIKDVGLVIVTLGLTEYWQDTLLDIPLNDVPVDWRYAKKTNRFEHRNYNFSQNLDVVRRLCDKIFSIAPLDAKILLTVSPVPLQRTFSNQDVIVANTYSKSTLRAVAEEISQADDRIAYFPSYEIVMNSPQEVAWKHDQRHVQNALVEHIIDKFERLYFS